MARERLGALVAGERLSPGIVELTAGRFWTRQSFVLCETRSNRLENICISWNFTCVHFLFLSAINSHLLNIIYATSMVPRKADPAPRWLKAAKPRRRNFAGKNAGKLRWLKAVDEVLTIRASSTRPHPRSASPTVRYPFLPGPSALSISDFNLVEKLGEGTSATVYLTRHLATEFACALKVTDKVTWSDEIGRSSTLREIQVHEGLVYKHRKSLIHRDVKLENILVCSHNKVKLADFIFSQLCRSGFSPRKCGKTEYLSPDMAAAYLSPDFWDEFYVGATDQWN